MPRVLTIDYYRVRMPNQQRAFETLLTEIRDMRGRHRNLANRGDAYRLHTLSDDRGLFEGDLTHVRMDQIPPKADLAGSLEDFDLADDEGIGEQTAFLYDVETKVLAFQRNKYGFSGSMFAYYCESKTGLDAPIVFDMVLRSDAIERLNRMQQITKFHVQFARVENPRFFAQPGRSTDAFVDMLSDFRAPSADIILSVGRGQRNESLPVTAVRSAANALRRVVGGQHRDANDVKRIEVSGRNVEDERDVLDLIDERTVDKVNANVIRRRLPYAGSRKPALRGAFDRRRDEFRQMFRRARR